MFPETTQESVDPTEEMTQEIKEFFRAMGMQVEVLTKEQAQQWMRRDTQNPTNTDSDTPLSQSGASTNGSGQ